MISFTEGGLIDVWPDKESPQIQALSYAMQQAMIRVKSYADQARCYSMVDDLPEDILDYFAVEMRAMYYEQNLSIEQKREIVKNTLKWYTYAGTPATVADMVTVVFGKGEIQEWFDYTDPPFTPGTFDIITSARLTPDIIDQLASMIKKAKNVRSHIRGVVIVRDIHSDAHVAIHQVAVQESTVLNIIREDKEAGQATYAATVAGAVSQDSCVLNTVNQDAEAPAGQSMAAYGVVTENQSCITNENNGITDAHSSINIAQKGDIYNITSFIKEEH